MNDSILNVDVSCFKNYKTSEPKTINLLSWLQSTKFKKEVDAIRLIADKTQRDELKSKLPAITPSGLFSYRNAQGLIKHSGLMAIDIDLKGNENIANFKELKNELKKMKFVAYAGLSVSGSGFWVLIPIEDNTKHIMYFDLIANTFNHYGIKIDSACKDVCRLRGYSYDESAYFNHRATILRLPINYTSSLNKHQQRQKNTTYQNSTDAFEKLVHKIQIKNIDITNDYTDWNKIGFALVNEFGENGRNYFHSISCISNSYNYDECDKEYTKLIKYNKGKVSIASIYYQCKLHGIT